MFSSKMRGCADGKCLREATCAVVPSRRQLQVCSLVASQSSVCSCAWCKLQREHHFTSTTLQNRPLCQARAQSLSKQHHWCDPALIFYASYFRKPLGWAELTSLSKYYSVRHPLCAARQLHCSCVRHARRAAVIRSESKFEGRCLLRRQFLTLSQKAVGQHQWEACPAGQAACHRRRAAEGCPVSSRRCLWR